MFANALRKHTSLTEIILPGRGLEYLEHTQSPISLRVNYNNEDINLTTHMNLKCLMLYYPIGRAILTTTAEESIIHYVLNEVTIV